MINPQRADPNLIHWQSIGEPQPDLQQEARALIFAGSGHRPPSYTSEETVDVHGLPEVIATPPLPQLAERRQAATVSYMRHQYRGYVY